MKEITPDHLMDNFRGRSLKSIIVFTLIVHVVGLTATSTTYLWKMVAGGDSSKLTEEQRVELAVKEATSSLRGIAEKHGLKPQDLGERFAGKAPKAPTEKTTPEPADGVTPKEASPKEEPAKVASPAEPEKPKSEIEKQINTKQDGPKLPAAEEEKEDLFK